MFLPWLGLILVPRRTLKEHRHAILALAGFYLGCVFTALAPFPAEAALNKMGFQARFAFQLVRNGKYIIVPSFVITALLATVAWQVLAARLAKRRVVAGALICALLGLTLASRLPIFNGVPFLGDDVVKFLWPGRDGPRPFSEQMDGVLRWARENTAEDARFVGPRLIRVGAQRPVIYDFAGAGMLIEGDPEAFVEAARRRLQLKAPEYADPVAQADLFASWGGEFWVTQTQAPKLKVAYYDSGWYVYDIRGLRGKAQEGGESSD